MPILFILGLVGLILFQKEAVMPFVQKVASSDLFMVDSDDEGSRIKTNTSMTHHAFMQCNKEIRETVSSETNITFPSKALQAWALGNYKYLINAEIELNTASGESLFKRYACQIQYEEGADLEGVMDADNWSINGLSGLSGLD